MNRKFVPLDTYYSQFLTIWLLLCSYANYLQPFLVLMLIFFVFNIEYLQSCVLYICLGVGNEVLGVLVVIKASNHGL